MDKFLETAIINLALQRDPSFITRVFHDLKKNAGKFPSLMENEEIAKNENVIAIKNVNPKIIDYHLHGIPALKQVIFNITKVMDWVCFPYASVMLSLYRGYFPKLYSPNSLYTFLMNETESAIFNRMKDARFDEISLLKTESTLNQLQEAVESLWGLKIPRLQFKFGPISPQDFLVSISTFDDMVIIHPLAYQTHYWPSIVVQKITRLLIQKHYPKMNERTKDHLSILTSLATFGKPVEIPGYCYNIMKNHPVDHAQYQMSLIVKDLRLYGDFDHKLLHFFPRGSMDDLYSIDMISSLILFLIDENQVDERDLFARVTASNAGFRQFNDNFMLFKKAIPRLEKLGVLEENADNGIINIVSDSKISELRG